MSEGSDCLPLLMASLFSVKMLIEYGAILVTDFDPKASCFGQRSFYFRFGVYMLYLIKNLRPLWVYPVRKRVQALKIKRARLLLRQRFIYCSQSLLVYKLL
jgi:hypothetical protein